MVLTLDSAVSTFGASATSKLSNPAAKGSPEDQLRAPLEELIGSLALLAGGKLGQLVLVGETTLSTEKTRPDYAATILGTLIGFIELKAPGKGADPRKFKDEHDKEQWKKLNPLPNLIYTDGNEFSLWRSGVIVGSIVRLKGNIENSGSKLEGSQSLITLFSEFFSWKPIAPATAKQLAEMTARLCRLLRDEVSEQMGLKNPALTDLATDWRALLFPEASDDQFADGYAQTVTFALLLARAKGIRLSTGLDPAAKSLGKSNSLIGTALRVLTDDAENLSALKTSINTLVRVLDVVDWTIISRDRPEAWLYFYEDFLEVYDNKLRKMTGSYYTPPEVVGAMVRLVDDVLQSRFFQPDGLASEEVTLVDPCVGTGTFLLGALHRIADTIKANEGPGAIAARVDAAVSRLIAFELQLGPFVVAQMRVLAELFEMIGSAPSTPLRMYVTDTLANPFIEEKHLAAMFRPISESRKQANEVKKNVPIMVVIGNPPYKEKAKGRGRWIEKGSETDPSPLADWLPPADWGIGSHTKHLRNLYVYFWRWATWKVFDHKPNHGSGIVCFITVAGFLNGPGFQKMRDYLRRKTDEIWVIDCTPEGHQPDVSSRIFEGVQQPICIVLASRSPKTREDVPAVVRYRSLHSGKRTNKFTELSNLNLDGVGWVDCSPDWRSPFLPELVGDWSTYPALEDFFIYNGSGVMPGRTWVIAPDSKSLFERWAFLQAASEDQKQFLFHPHMVKKMTPAGEMMVYGDRHASRSIAKGLPGFTPRPLPVGSDPGTCVKPVRYAYRSFDRQWIIPDNRLINRPNPDLWASRSEKQVYLTALERTSPSSGPGLSITGLVPDLDHYRGSFGGRVLPLWMDSGAQVPNIPPLLLAELGNRFKLHVSPEDLISYIACVVAHPGYIAKFNSGLKTPGLRIPVTEDGGIFQEASKIGKLIIWLHSFGERFSDNSAGRPAGPPRVLSNSAPTIPVGGAIPHTHDLFPDSIDYDPEKKRLMLGSGFIDGVIPQVWDYDVSGKQVLLQWFSYRRANRERPVIGDKRPPSPLGDIQPDHWLPEYTTELLNVLHVLTLLVELEPQQSLLLEKICSGPTISINDFISAGALLIPESYPSSPLKVLSEESAPSLFPVS
jgi:hypothetical protein